MHEQTLTMLRGLPASGKSTYAPARIDQEPRTVRVNRDSIRAMCGVRWTPDKEDMFHAMEVALAEIAIRHGYSVIVDDTNLKEFHRAKWAKFAEKNKVKFSVVVMNVPLEVCIARDAERISGHVGEPIIRRMTGGEK